jgi:hypothetical protein
MRQGTRRELLTRQDESPYAQRISSPLLSAARAQHRATGRSVVAGVVRDCRRRGLGAAASPAVEIGVSQEARRAMLPASDCELLVDVRLWW